MKNSSIIHFFQLHQNLLLITLNYRNKIPSLVYMQYIYVCYCLCIYLLRTEIHIWLSQNLTIPSVLFKKKKRFIVCFCDWILVIYFAVLLCVIVSLFFCFFKFISSTFQPNKFISSTVISCVTIMSCIMFQVWKPPCVNEHYM